MTTSLLITILSCISLVLMTTIACFFVFMRRSYRELSRTAKRVAEELGTGYAISFSTFAATLTGTIGGRTFECRISPPFRTRPRQLFIELSGRYPSVTVRRQTGFDTFCSRFGIVRNIMTGDRDFDTTYYIDSVNREFALIFFTAQLPRIKALLSCPGVTGLTLEAKGVRLTLDDIDFELITGARIRELLSSLTTFAERLEIPETASSQGISSEKMTAIQISAMAALLILGIIGQSYTHTAFPHLDESPLALFWPVLAPTLAVSLVVLLAQYLALRKRTDVHMLLATQAPLCLIAIFMLCQSGYLYVNAAFDEHPGETHLVAVTNRSSYKGHFLYCRAWDGTLRKIMVKQAFYDEVSVGDQVLFHIKPGHLGAAWIAGYEKK